MIFSSKEIVSASFFGGPVTAGFLMSKNFKAFGDNTSASKSVFLGIAFTAILYSILFSVPEESMEKIPNALIPVFYTAIILILVERIQGEKIRQYRSMSSTKTNYAALAGYSLFGLVLNLSFIFLLGFLSPFEGYEEEFRYNENTVIYYSKNMDPGFISTLADGITRAGIIDESAEVDLFFREDPGKFTLYLILEDSTGLNDIAFIAQFNEIERMLNDYTNLPKTLEIAFMDPQLKNTYPLKELVLEGKDSFDPMAEMITYTINENHTVYHNPTMKMEEVAKLEQTIKTLKGYFPEFVPIDIIFLNDEPDYALKFFVPVQLWNNPKLIKRYEGIILYLHDYGIEPRIRLYFIDPETFAEQEINYNSQNI